MMEQGEVNYGGLCLLAIAVIEGLPPEEKQEWIDWAKDRSISMLDAGSTSDKRTGRRMGRMESIVMQNMSPRVIKQTRQRQRDRAAHA